MLVDINIYKHIVIPTAKMIFNVKSTPGYLKCILSCIATKRPKLAKQHMSGVLRTIKWRKIYNPCMYVARCLTWWYFLESLALRLSNPGLDAPGAVLPRLRELSSIAGAGRTTVVPLVWKRFEQQTVIKERRAKLGLAQFGVKLDIDVLSL